MNAKICFFQMVKKAQAASGGGPIEKLKAGEDDLYEVFQESLAFTGLNVFMISDNTKEGLTDHIRNL